jgi:acetyltransferase-like isoleucine patch superfamily enzyme
VALGRMAGQSGLLGGLPDYLQGQASNVARYALQETVTSACSWVPSLPGIALRALAYKLIMRVDGFAAIENGVRIAYAENIRLGAHVYLDRGVYLHGCPGGIDIGSHAFIMHNAELHVFNFRSLPHAFIKIGSRTFVGESVVIRGQGGVDIGAAVLIGPGAQILAVNHNYDDPTQPIMDQGISGRGIVIEDGAWIGAGAIVLDGVRVGCGAVIGAHAVVTRDVPAHTLVAGAPARIVRDFGSGERSTSGRVSVDRRNGHSRLDLVGNAASVPREANNPVPA